MKRTFTALTCLTLSIFTLATTRTYAHPFGVLEERAQATTNTENVQLEELKDFGQKLLNIALHAGVTIQPTTALALMAIKFVKSKDPAHRIEVMARDMMHETVVWVMPTDERGELDYDSQEECLDDVLDELAAMDREPLDNEE